MGYPPQRSLNPAQNQGHIREQILQDVAVNRCGIVGALSLSAARSVGVVRAFPFVGGVMVHHRIHVSGGNCEVKVGLAQFFKIAQIVLPVGLWHNGHPQAFGFENPTDYSSAK